jgi:folylpolyglutamate synthase/dihydropteroate synthase
VHTPKTVLRLPLHGLLETYSRPYSMNASSHHEYSYSTSNRKGMLSNCLKQCTQPCTIHVNPTSNTQSFVQMLPTKAMHTKQVRMFFIIGCCCDSANSSTRIDFVNRNVDPVAVKELTLQKELAAVWLTMDPNTRVIAVPSIEEAVEEVQKIENDIGSARVLVTGSFHLVGGMLSILEGEQYGVASIISQ